MTDIVAKTCKRAKVGKLGIEGDSMTVCLRDQHRQEAAQGPDCKRPTGLVEQLRAIKDSDEIAEIREAIRFAEDALSPASRLDRSRTERKRKSPTSWSIRCGCSARRPPAFRRSSPSGPGRAAPRPANAKATRRCRLLLARLGRKRPALQQRLDAFGGHR